MNPAEVVALLSVALAHDGRHDPGDELVQLAWREVAARGGWTFEEAQEQIHRHYAHSGRYLAPGEITQRIQRARAVALDRQRRDAQLGARRLPPPDPPTPERRSWLRRHWRNFPALDDSRSNTP